jgi:glycosyltransferase involved in cell wall biosynthesis
MVGDGAQLPLLEDSRMRQVEAAGTATGGGYDPATEAGSGRGSRDEGGSRPPTFVLAVEYDLSLTTGYSINEREATVALLNHFGDRIRVIAPRPAHPDAFSDSRIHYVRNHDRHHPARYPPFVLEFRRKLRELLAERPAAAVIFRLGPFPVLPALTLRSGVPVILRTLEGHSLFVREDRRPFRRLVSRGAAPLYRFVTERCLGADIESHAYGRWLPSMFPIAPAKMRIVPNGANTAFFSPQNRLAARKKYGWEGFDHIVGYVGAMDSLRCADAIVKAAVRLRDVPRLLFVLVGGGPLEGAIREEVSREGLTDRVVLPGFFPYDEVPAVMSALDIALDLTRVPLVVEGQEFFGSFSQKIAQYLACGVPVIAWETPDTTFLDEAEIGATVAIGDLDRLAIAIRKLLGADAPLRAAGARARRYAVERLSSEMIARTRIDFWDQLVGSSAVGRVA